MRLNWLVVALLAGGCGQEVSLGSVVDSDDTDEPEVTASCLDELSGVNDTIFLDQDGPDTQIHAASAFDGDGMWVVYNRPQGSQFAVYALHVRCDRTVDIGPFKVSDSDDSLLDPTVAVDGGRMLVAWQADDGGSPYNLSIRARLYTTQGDPAADPFTFALSRAGTVNEGNAWMPALTALPDGGYAMAGAWGHSDAPAFQVFVQRLDRDAQPIGDAIDVDLQPDWTQVYPSITSGLDGSLYVSWSSQDETDTRIRRGTIFPGQDEAASVLTVDASGDAPSASAGVGRTWFAYHSAASNKTNVRVVATNGAAFELGEAAAWDTLPAVAGGEDGGAVAWYVGQNTLRIARFDSTGAVKQDRDLGVSDAGPYPINLTRVADDIYFLAWSAGQNPDFRLEGQYIQF